MKRTRWAGRLVGGLLAVASANGCKQQLYLEPSDYAEAAKGGGQGPLLEARPDLAITPGLVPGTSPATVLDPARPPRPIRLPEAIAIALENGGTGGFAATNPGFGSETLSSFAGRGTNGNDSIRAYALDPASAAAEIERSLSKFDARWLNSITWNKVDNPVLNFQQSFQNGDTAQLNSTLAKPLPTGGVAGITFTTNYTKLASPPTTPGFSTLNVSYSPAVQFSFEQPLLQGFGVEINQLLGSHPGSQLIQGLRPSGGSGSEGILITRIRLDQQRAQFDTLLNQMLLNVEGAYWNLLSSYYNLNAQEEGLKQSLDSYTFYRARADRGLNREQVALQALAQYFSFAQQVVNARGQVLENERQLRLILNLRSDDGTRLLPVDDLIQAPFTPDFKSATEEAIANRPELLIQRQELKAKQLNVLLQKNLRRPDLRFVSSYTVQGLGSRLDGPGVDPVVGQTNNAFRSLGSNNFDNYTLGLRLDMPLGFRDANALVRQAQLQLQQEFVRLDLNERKAEELVTRYYRQVVQSHREAQYFRMQRKTQQRFVDLDQQIREVGAISKEEASAFVLNLIQSQQQLAQSTAREFAALAQYNTSLAGLEYAKGTIQQYNRITVAEGALPAAVGKKAADHFAAREAALELRQHPADGPQPPQFRAPMTDDQIRAGEQAILNGMKADGIAPPPGIGLPPEMIPSPKPAAPPAAAGGTVGARPTVPPYPTTVPPASRPQLVPADTNAGPPGTFSPVGTVTLPTRSPVTPPAPVPVSTTPVMAPLPPVR